MKVKQCDVERFLSDAGNHVMEIEKDDGVHRSIYFGREDPLSYHFRLNTWPGHLCISGDMGTYVFSRLNDMFDFFRVDDIEKINPQYWGEKLESIDKNCKYTEFDEEEFRDRIKEDFDEWQKRISEEQEELGGKNEDWQIEMAWSDVEDKILSKLGDDYDGRAAFSAAIEFPGDDKEYPFSEYWELDCSKYSFHFIWCLYAIVWGIQQYDKAKADKQG